MTQFNTLYECLVQQEMIKSQRQNMIELKTKRINRKK